MTRFTVQYGDEEIAIVCNYHHYSYGPGDDLIVWTIDQVIDNPALIFDILWKVRQAYEDPTEFERYLVRMGVV